MHDLHFKDNSSIHGFGGNPRDNVKLSASDADVVAAQPHNCESPFSRLQDVCLLYFSRELWMMSQANLSKEENEEASVIISKGIETTRRISLRFRSKAQPILDSLDDQIGLWPIHKHQTAHSSVVNKKKLALLPIEQNKKA